MCFDVNGGVEQRLQQTFASELDSGVGAARRWFGIQSKSEDNEGQVVMTGRGSNGPPRVTRNFHLEDT